MYHSRIDRSHAVRVKAELLLAGYQQVAEKDIGFGTELFHQVNCFGLGEVHLHGLLATIIHIKLEVMFSDGAINLRLASHVAHRITRKRFHLDDAGTQVSKDGTRTWRNPKPKTEPTPQQIMQQAVYWKATGDEPGLLFVTPAGYNIVTAENCDALRKEALEATYEDVVQRWVVQQNLLKAANQSWSNLFGLVQPDFGQIAGRHGPDILKIAREIWRF